MNFRACRAFYKRDELSSWGPRTGHNIVKERAHRSEGRPVEERGPTMRHAVGSGGKGSQGAIGESEYPASRSSPPPDHKGKGSS
jgi:hypothetical protein